MCMEAAVLFIEQRSTGLKYPYLGTVTGLGGHVWHYARTRSGVKGSRLKLVHDTDVIKNDNGSVVQVSDLKYGSPLREWRGRVPLK